MTFFFGRKSRGIPPNATFSLTQSGRAKIADEYKGDPKSRIMFALESGGTQTIEEISNGSGLTRGQVEREVLSLVSHQYVQIASSNIGSSMSGGDEL